MSEPLNKDIANLFSEDRSVEEIEAGIFELLLNSLEPSIRTIVERLALPHWFDQSIINVLIDDQSSAPTELSIKNFLALSFVKSRGDRTFVLHEQVRERLLAT